MIPAGQLRFIATRYTAGSTVDALGLRNMDQSTYSTDGTFRCSMRGTGAMEIPYGDGVVVVNTWELQARSSAVGDLKQTDRLSVNGRIMNIRGIRNEDARDIMVIIDCEEVLNELD